MDLPSQHPGAATVLDPMTAPEFSEWLMESIPTYAKDKVQVGQWSATEALASARREIETILTRGCATPGHHLYTMRESHAPERIGTVWIGIQEQAGQLIGFVYDIEVVPAHRRRGHATRALLALEEKAHQIGLAGIALHVFGHNIAARKLYEKLGYVATNINMFKDIHQSAH